MKESKSGSFLVNSFTDLMASLAVIFILLTVVFIKYASERSEKGKQVIRQSLAEVLDKDQLPLVQDPNDPLSLSVRVSEDYLKFPLNSSSISLVGTRFIERFFPSLAEQLCQEEIRTKLDSVIIEGHTDKSGEDKDWGSNQNIRLSQQRALAVLVQGLNSLKDHPDLHGCLLKLASASGRGASSPVVQEGTYSADLSRRVEIKIRVKSNEQEFFSKAAR